MDTLGRTPLLIYVIGILDLLALAVTLPVLPLAFAHHGLSDVAVGYTAGCYSLLILLLSPVYGRLSDKHGRVLFLQLSALGTMLGCFLCASATGPEMFVVGRILPGLLSCRLPVSQAYIADISTGKERSERFGTLMASFSIAFIIGPLIGGTLAKVHITLPLYVSFFICILHLLVTLLLREPETRKVSSSQEKPQPVQAIWQGPNSRKLWAFVHVRIAFMFGRSIYETLFSQHAKHQFGLNGQQTGWMLSYIGLVSVLVNMFVVRRLPKHELTYLVPLAACQSLGLFAWGVITNMNVVVVAMTALAFSNNCFANILDSQMAELSPSGAHGAVMGFCSSVDRITRIVAPSLGGLILHYMGATWIGVLAAAVTTYSAVVLLFSMKLFKQGSDRTDVKAD